MNEVALREFDNNAPAVVQQQSHMQSQAVARLADWAESAIAAHRVAESLVQTSFVPEAFRGKPHEATAAILAGSEVGLSPMSSLRSFDVIQGTAAPRAITLRAIVQSQGHEVWVKESTASRAIVCGRRRGSNVVETSTWTLDRAKGLGLMNKHNWKAQPQAMLVARATSEVCRLVAADAILGIGYTVEELSDEAGTAAPPQAGEPQPSTRKMSRKPKQAEPEPEREEHAAEHPPESPLLNTSSQLAKHMFALFGECGITDKDERLAFVSDVVGREVGTSKEMTDADAEAVVGALNVMRDRQRQEAAEAERICPCGSGTPLAECCGALARRSDIPDEPPEAEQLPGGES